MRPCRGERTSEPPLCSIHSHTFDKIPSRQSTMLAFVSLIVYATIAVVFSTPGNGASVALLCARKYTVKTSDICDRICKHELVSTFQLSFTNPQINADCTNLEVGEPLCLGWEGKDCRDVYIIQPDDTCDSIAAMAKIAVSTLKANNPNINRACDNLREGEVVCISSIIVPYNS